MPSLVPLSDAACPPSLHTRAEKFNARTSADIKIMQELGEYFQSHPDEICSTVKPDVSLFRYRVTESFMFAGVPPAKIDKLRTLLERSGQSLCSSSHLKMMIPKVESDEFVRIMEEVSGQLVTAIFDSTTRVGEALNILLRFCTNEFRLVQRLIGFITTKRHMNAVEVQTVITQLLLTRLQVSIPLTVGFERDSASVNGAAVRRLRNTFSYAVDILCFCQ